jgi:hypothetical protein
MSHLTRVLARVPKRTIQRAAFALVLACGISLATSIIITAKRTARATERLDSAAHQLDALTDNSPSDDKRRTAIAWGYSERLRLGLESPFRLVEAAARDPRLTSDERRTVAWALLAHIVRGETHRVDAAALDGLGPLDAGRSATGEQHLELIEHAIERAENPRAGELAVRFAYTLAVAERLLDGSAPVLAAEAAAMVADREIARREATAVLRSARGSDPIDVVRRRRERRSFYVERPVLLAPTAELERAAIAQTTSLLVALRRMRFVASASTRDSATDLDDNVVALAPRLYAAGARVPPSAPLAVTVQRYLALLRAQAPRVDHDALARTRNTEMLVAVTRVRDAGQRQRRALGRLLLAAGVSMRSLSQEPIWFGTDSGPTATSLATSLGVADIAFDRDVPGSWRPYYLKLFGDGVRDFRQVFPTMKLSELHVRFRMNSPADSALAMHDPRTRTLHLPVLTAGGTLTHELAHDLDRQSALGQGFAGYQSDIVARGGARSTGWNTEASGRLAASLRALTEELSEAPRVARQAGERPAEIFATRVDWFVASALARQGISSGFLSAVQDELLTGHVVHPERLRSSGRSRSLLTALEAMTTVAPFAQQEEAPSVQTLLRWSLAGPVDRRVASEIVRGEPRAWLSRPFSGERFCADDETGRVALIRMAAESRARGWLRLRARWTPESERSSWARSLLGQSPWSAAVPEGRIAEMRDYILVALASSVELPAGLSAYAGTLALRARCGQ